MFGNTNKKCLVTQFYAMFWNTNMKCLATQMWNVWQHKYEMFGNKNIKCLATQILNVWQHKYELISSLDFSQHSFCANGWWGHILNHKSSSVRPHWLQIWMTTRNTNENVDINTDKDRNTDKNIYWYNAYIDNRYWLIWCRSR